MDPAETTDAELRILKALWALKKGSVAEIRERHNELFGADLAYTTVMTLLGRLAAKGAVKVDKARQPFFYRPASKAASVLGQRARSFVDKVFDGSAFDLVLRLVESEQLTADELARLEARLGEKKKR